jgi:hypothetical protein
MRSLKLVVLGIVALAIPSFAAARTLTCTATGGMLGAPNYQLKYSGSTVQLHKVPLNPTAHSTLIASSTGIIQYGDATFFLANHGRSGYAFLYVNKSIAVIDVNLFGAHGSTTNTGKPLTNYKCTWR